MASGSDKRKQEVKAILDAVDDELRFNFTRIYRQSINANTKGGAYEMAVKDFLSSYMNGVFELNTRGKLIDKDLNFVDVFEPSENEFDVVASFKSSLPRIMANIQGTNLVPYDGVAVILEAKQTLTKKCLEEDLQKLEKLDKLSYCGPFSTTRSPLCPARPIRVLFYYEKIIKEVWLHDLLLAHEKAWDIIIFYKDDRIFINPALPMISYHQKWEPGHYWAHIHHSVLWMVIAIATSIPLDVGADTCGTFLSLLKEVQDDVPSEGSFFPKKPKKSVKKGEKASKKPPKRSSRKKIKPVAH